MQYCANDLKAPSANGPWRDLEEDNYSRCGFDCDLSVHLLSGNNTAPARARAAVFVDGREVCVLAADNTAPAGARAAVVVDGWEDDILSLVRDGGGGESVHLIKENEGRARSLSGGREQLEFLMSNAFGNDSDGEHGSKNMGSLKLSSLHDRLAVDDQQVKSKKGLRKVRSRSGRDSGQSDRRAIVKFDRVSGIVEERGGIGENHVAIDHSSSDISDRLPISRFDLGKFARILRILEAT
ncbi:hypothetical protein B0H11DRAFT_1923657 [Mycena galericulata]|nr:hypothetical protein B0H11DRAFT_1923657 [Mycena galericulata]